MRSERSELEVGMRCRDGVCQEIFGSLAQFPKEERSESNLNLSLAFRKTICFIVDTEFES